MHLLQCRSARVAAMPRGTAAAWGPSWPGNGPSGARSRAAGAWRGDCGTWNGPALLLLLLLLLPNNPASRPWAAWTCMRVLDEPSWCFTCCTCKDGAELLLAALHAGV